MTFISLFQYYTYLNHLTVGIGLPDTLAVSVKFCLS